MTVMVTGIGFVGAYIVRDLLASGSDVVLYGLFGGIPDGESDYVDIQNARQITRGQDWSRVTVVPGDIRDTALLEATLRTHKVTKVIHLASIMAAAAERDPSLAVSVNVGGSVALFEAAVRVGVERIVWASSINIYGPKSAGEDGVISDASPVDPTSVYGTTKVCVEGLAARYHLNHGLNVVGLRLGKVYGFGEHVKAGRGGGNTWFANLIELPARGLGPTVVPFGEASLGFQYIEDIASAVVAALGSTLGAGQSFLTGGDYRPVREAFEYVRSILPEAQMTLENGGEAAGLKAGAETNWARRYDGTRLAEILGFHPRFSMEQGIHATVNAYRDLAGLPAVPPPLHAKQERIS
ncbi:NAD(P)-dependent oxidoreductase [Arthrobacter sp. M4]|uniref:NAD-dependent epimerase/dehydratase family protein n=1 Tax=Arthrobacter sp. M4 TaxID=218160 RepID=UPI001CDB75EF|nr:NAD(P)-dependent oxidoreductase [Arthrobacter sp. M4]MCA4135378.1 NAD(P)-dependent oxidoreductase [Arthrobacter sp. M4]